MILFFAEDLLVMSALTEQKCWGRSLLELFFDYLLTPFCPGCKGQTGYGFCGQCAETIVPQMVELPNLTTVYAAGAYEEGPLRRAIYEYKANNNFYLSALLAGWMVRALPNHLGYESERLLVPVPTTISRFWRRGFSPAHLLARRIAAVLQHLQYAPASLYCTSNKASQKMLRRGERFANARGTYRAQQVYGRSVLLIDDVCTTGATLYSACQSLYEAGAVRVDCAVVGLVPGAIVL